jgi:hypothetical protein
MKKVIFFICILSLSGCSTFHEVHFFKDKATPIPNYYKLSVKGQTLFSSSRYLSGYFDEEAVDDYFSEITQPEKARFKPHDNTQNNVEPLDSKLDNRRLVLILSSNSDAVATQIGAFVENKKNEESLSRLLNLDKHEKYNTVDQKLTVEKTKGQMLVELGNTLIEGTDPTTVTPAEANAKFLQYLNVLASSLGNSRPFISIPEAKAWLEMNRTTLLNQGQ